MRYGTKGIDEKDEFALSRKLFFVECLLEYFIQETARGVYFAKLTTTVGISDSMTAILAELTSLSGFFQLFSILLAHKTPVKRWILPLMTFSQLLIACVYMIPLLDLSLSTSALFFIIILLARATQSIATPAKSNWMRSLVEPSRRGEYISRNNMISISGGMVFTVTMSGIIDHFEKIGNINNAFLCFTIVILVISVLHLISLLPAKEPIVPQQKKTSSLASAWELLKNKRYRCVLFSYGLFAVATGTVVPFLGTYQINELGFSMTFISIRGIVMSFFSIGCYYAVGKYSLRSTYGKLLQLSHIFYATAFFFIMITGSGLGIVTYTAYTVIATLAGATRNVSSVNLLYEISSPEHRTTAIAINTMTTGFVSFITTICASRLVSYIQSLNNQIFGIKLYAQQLLAAISVFIIIVVIVYYRLVCKKQIDSNVQQTEAM